MDYVGIRAELSPSPEQKEEEKKEKRDVIEIIVISDEEPEEIVCEDVSPELPSPEEVVHALVYDGFDSISECVEDLKKDIKDAEILLHRLQWKMEYLDELIHQ